MAEIAEFTNPTKVGDGSFPARYFGIGAVTGSKVAKWKVKRGDATVQGYGTV
jgi:hypothetical protein